MLHFSFLAVFIIGVIADEESLSNSNSTYEDRIIGGGDATVGQFPYQVSLRDNNSTEHFCGGSIITKRFILTAAHCTDLESSKPQNVRVVVGAHRVSSGGTHYTVDKILKHPGYGPIDLSNDISIVRTTHPIKYSALVRPITLPTTDLPVDGGLPVIVSGWGKNPCEFSFSGKHSYFNIFCARNIIFFSKFMEEWRL